MSNLGSAVLDALRQAGLRCTPQRYAVLECLMRRPEHATAEEIYNALVRTRPRLSRASVYNNLKALAGGGLVREAPIEGGAARFDLRLKRHHHFVCEACGAIEDVEWFDLPRQAGREALGSRKVREYEIVFRGTCQNCV